MRWTPLAVFWVALLGLSYNIWNAGVASGYVDPLARIGAQDEAIYGSEAIAMATGGGWLTQTFMHRWEMSKPPLLMWLTALAFKIGGISRVALHAPTLFCGALLAALVCGLVAPARGVMAGVAAAVLVTGNPLLYTLARHALTDIVVAAATTAAMLFFMRDTALSRWSTVTGIGMAVAAAILAKSLLGVLPLAVIVLASGGVRPENRPSPWRLAVACGLAIGLAAPWFVYQLAVHHQYFWAEMNVIFGQAQGVKPQQTQESALGYYAARLAMLDPVLALLAATGLWGFWSALLRRDSLAVLVLCWIAVLSAVLLGFRFRSAPYMAPLVPAFVVLAARWSPLASRRWAAPLLAVLLVLTGVKAAHGERPWGLPWSTSAPIASGAALQRYCDLRRSTDLILFDAGDQFYGATLPLAQVRYAWVDPAGVSFALNPHLQHLGILLSAEQFAAAPPHAYLGRMQRWGLHDDQAAGTGIALHSAAELQGIVDARPGSDFLLPADQAAALHGTAHDLVLADARYAYLLAKKPIGNPAPRSGWSCRF